MALKLKLSLVIPLFAILTLTPAIAVGALPATAQAQSPSGTAASSCVGEVPPYLAPASLAMMAYQGYLEKQGIPGYQVFQEQYRFSKLTAAQIVQAAIKGCLLSDKYGVASDPDYVQDLAMQVQILIQENR